jgi:hypothetical protein
MPQTAKESFVHREKNFFKANSTFKKADGWDVNRMVATVGFTPRNVKHNNAVMDLKSQEHGGTIFHRELGAHKEARTGNSFRGKIRRRDSIEALKDVGIVNAKGELNKDKIISAQNVKFSGSRRKSKARFMRAAMATIRYGNGYMLGNKYGRGKQTLMRIESVSSNRKTGQVSIKRTALYSYEEGRVAKVNKTGFMKRASFESGLKMPDYFYQNAKKEYERFRK